MIINCGFEKEIEFKGKKKAFKYINKQGIYIPDGLPYKERRAEINKHAPGPEWRLTGYYIVKETGGTTNAKTKKHNIIGS